MSNGEETPNILEVLDGVRFPAALIDLVEFAEEHDASEDVMDRIRALPDWNYNSVRDIAHHLDQIERLPGDENLWPSAPSGDMFTEDERPVDLSHENIPGIAEQ